jgi:hypothetical protein
MTATKTEHVHSRETWESELRENREAALELAAIHRGPALKAIEVLEHEWADAEEIPDRALTDLMYAGPVELKDFDGDLYSSRELEQRTRSLATEVIELRRQVELLQQILRSIGVQMIVGLPEEAAPPMAK